MRLRRLRVDRGRLSFSGRGRDTRGTILRAVLVDLVRDREWGRERLQALAGRCIRRGRFRAERVVVRVDRALLRDRALARHDLGLGIGQELLRAG